MGEGPKRPATYEDLVALPENMVGQIVDGELIALPRPASAHGRASSRLGGELYGAFERGRAGPGGWVFIDEPELHFGRDVLVPDLAGWRWERMPETPNAPFFTLAPDWVCEVLSPSTTTLDRVRKKRIYAREGVKYVWLIDPEARTLEAYLGDGRQWVELGTYSGNERVRVAPFEALELELGVLWLSERKAP
ncbi:Uma2 family endonuclease [Myxococcus sp. K15C18031901]|uniref:Uma2 family endonuclease n=1 Tax=Myxococcus dinghuensis TaxID=2906761 RepID=UPI0020A7BAD1|nr:Uma2 family endonuclease [Myxococcus dinghuensis]MCP3098293.1 Uma2 family endonuclease [Myxococcus dinghuensis]